MDMLIMAYACKTSTARKIVGVIPYLPYSRQCKQTLVRVKLPSLNIFDLDQMTSLDFTHNCPLNPGCL